MSIHRTTKSTVKASRRVWAYYRAACRALEVSLKMNEQAEERKKKDFGCVAKVHQVKEKFGAFPAVFEGGDEPHGNISRLGTFLKCLVQLFAGGAAGLIDLASLQI